jgi:hypothetical protein
MRWTAIYSAVARLSLLERALLVAVPSAEILRASRWGAQLPQMEASDPDARVAQEPVRIVCDEVYDVVPHAHHVGLQR